MSAWNPIKRGNLVGVCRIWNCYGKPSACAKVVHMHALDGFDFSICAASSAPGEPPHTASAKAKDLASAKVIGAALAKMMRQECQRVARRKAVKQARANMTLDISILKGGAE